MRNLLCTKLAVLTAMIAMSAAVPAQARVFVGLGLGVPFYGPAYIPPPVYYPPPVVYYAPPPVYYTPPQPAYSPPAYTQPRSSAEQSCYAGPYVCPMERPVATGAGCYCLNNSGQRVSGRAN